MAKKPKITQKTKAVKPSIKSRRLKTPKYRSFRLSKSIRHPAAKLPGALRILTLSIKRLAEAKKLYLGIILVYGLLTIVFVRGFSGSLNLQELKTNLSHLFAGKWGNLSVGVTLFGLLLGNASGGTSAASGTYQSLFLIVVSLVMIWSLRQVQAGNKVGVKEAFYNGLYPLIPFLLVLIVIGLQLIPLLIGSALYSLVINNGIAVTFIEKAVWGLLFATLSLLSLYMVSSSLFAIYIVTLPDMTPMKALRSARELVRYRRWSVLRKVVFLPVALLVGAAIIFIPLILIYAPAAQWIFFACVMASLAIIHSYLYTLYRELL